MVGRAASGGALGQAIVAAMLMAFMAFLLALPLFWMAWDEDACIASGPAGERVTATQSNSMWPPGTECRYATHGETTERFVDAGPWDPLKWPVLVLLAAAPLTL